MRQAIIEIAVARKGGGKTYLTANEKISPYVKTTPTWKGRKVLIYDVNGEYTDKHCREELRCDWTAKTLALKDLPAWVKSDKAEVRRILPLNDKNQFTQDIDEMVEILRTILKTYRNGMLLLEDINAYLIDASSKDVVSAFTRNRQRNMDVIVHYQSLRAIPPRILANMNFLRFHKTNENVSTIENKLNNAELFFIAQALVNHKFKSNTRFFCYVDNEMDKISGKFSKNDFRVACLTYLKENKPPFFKQQENRLGKKNNDALYYCISELEKYYGN